MTEAPLTLRRPGNAVILAAVTLLCLIWGSTWLVIKVGLEDLPPFTSVGIRFAIAAPLMALVAHCLSKREGGRPPGLRLSVIMGVLNLTLSYGIIYYCETVLPSGLVSVLWAVYPLFMAVLGHRYLRGERLSGRQGLGFIASFGGVGLLFWTDLRDIGPEAIALGALVLVSPLLTAIGHVFVKRAGPDVSSLLLNRNGMAIAAALLLSTGLIVERDRSIELTTRAVFSLVYLSSIGTVLAFAIYYWLLRFVRAGRLGLMAFVIPIIALAFGVMFGGEPLHAGTLGGAGLVVSGVVLVLRK